MNLGDYRDHEHLEIFNYLKSVETPVYDDKTYPKLYLDSETYPITEDKKDNVFEEAKQLFDELTIQRVNLHFQFTKKATKVKKPTKVINTKLPRYYVNSYY